MEFWEILMFFQRFFGLSARLIIEHPLFLNLMAEVIELQGTDLWESPQILSQISYAALAQYSISAEALCAKITKQKTDIPFLDAKASLAFVTYDTHSTSHGDYPNDLSIYICKADPVNTIQMNLSSKTIPAYKTK